ncbi:carbohydrate ABC transporter permease [Mesorhizobium sp. M7A.F.Ca.US.011.01.1.1]|uniref:carbohydrate ABC transporter permease n=1 Tax=Mesorhizobium sp. M7A.F.Ca.US.011.01.1.1 TaxID=2496741 RepID=UPI001FE09998|nr:carbohydrate ABC transporter permease [Mesorhizobium sp. M7A.F.Ca.US.011.01.1.1]
MLIPLVVMIFTSFKTLPEIHSGNIFIPPSTPYPGAWSQAWSQACVGVECPGLRRFYLNTFLIVVPAVILSTLIGALNGYALTKFDFPAKNVIFGVILFGCFTPYQAVLIPAAKTLSIIGLSGSIGGLILIHTIYGLPFTTMFFRNYYVTVPSELVKAAKIDGAGFFLIFAYILIPISGPMIVVVVIWQFTSIWNDFLLGSSFTFGLNAPIMVAVNNIVNTGTGDRPYNLHMAVAIIAAIPTLTVYILAGKYFVRGLMAGSVKG